MEFRFSGFGGQGIVLMGEILGNAAMLEGKMVAQNQSYGSAARGGTCTSTVTISNEEILELEPVEFDLLVVMSQASYNNFSSELRRDGILITEKNLVNCEPAPVTKCFAIPATDIAFHESGRKIIANIIMLGYLCAITNVVSKESLITSIRKFVSGKTLALNLKAFEKGYEIGLADSAV